MARKKAKKKRRISSYQKFTQGLISKDYYKRSGKNSMTFVGPPGSERRKASR